MTVSDQIALWGAIGQVAAALIGAVALILALVQLRDVRRDLTQSMNHNRASLAAAQQQIDDARIAADAQAKFFLVEYLERAENLELRGQSGRLGRTERSNWSQDMHPKAEKLSGLWEVVASLVKAQVIPLDFVESIYGYAIRRHWQILAPVVHALRDMRDEPDQRRNFEELAMELEARASARGA
jgi:hypothetical protein